MTRNVTLRLTQQVQVKSTTLNFKTYLLVRRENSIEEGYVQEKHQEVTLKLKKCLTKGWEIELETLKQNVQEKADNANQQVLEVKKLVKQQEKKLIESLSK
ncbi:hypothetical protein ACP6PL_11795 [Dapis sp. BLCC M126]